MRSNLATLALLTFVSFTAAVSNHHSARGHHKKHITRGSPAIPSNWSKGACMIDANDRVLNQKQIVTDSNTPASCIASCSSLGYSIAGVEFGQECWCGNQINHSGDAGKVVNDSECNTRCSGDSSTTCGATWRIQVYSKSTSGPKPTPIPSTWTEGDCIQDAPERVLRYGVSLPNNSPSTCIAYCAAKDYHVAGVENGNECWCGDAIKSSSSAGMKLDSSKCDARCTGNNGYTCGGFWTIQVFKDKTPTPKPDTSHTFKIVDNISGSTFFDHWNFWTDADPTEGQVKFLSKSAATSAKLAYVKNGVAIMKVDNTTTLGSGQNRNSIRVSSKKQYNKGLFIFDVAAMPYGCSVWPAMWMVGPNWPSQGELDILEGINLMTHNQYTLHTGTNTNCTTETFPPRKYEASGRTTGLTCASSPQNNAGCTYVDDDDASYGAGFNAAGGAVLAVYWETTGIRVWRFPRNKIPADIKSKQPKPNAWPTPVASWASTSCNIKDEFKNQNIIFDITLCGSWAGPAYPSSGCPGTCSDRIKNPRNFDTAAWKVNSVIVYQ